MTEDDVRRHRRRPLVVRVAATVEQTTLATLRGLRASPMVFFDWAQPTSAEHLETVAVDGNASTSRRVSAKATHTAFLHDCRWFGIQHAQAYRALLWPRGSLWTAREDPTIRMSSDRSLCGVARRSAALAAYMTFEWVLWPSRLPRATAWRAREHMLQAMFRALTVVTESRADGSEAHSSCCGRA